MKFLVFVIVMLLLSTSGLAGPAAYGVCQTGCNTVAVACYSAGGSIFGTVTAGLGILPAIAGCNSALGTCMTACIAAGAAPTI